MAPTPSTVKRTPSRTPGGVRPSQSPSLRSPAIKTPEDLARHRSLLKAAAFRMGSQEKIARALVVHANVDICPVDSQASRLVEQLQRTLIRQIFRRGDERVLSLASWRDYCEQHSHQWKAFAAARRLLVRSRLRKWSRASARMLAEMWTMDVAVTRLGRLKLSAALHHWQHGLEEDRRVTEATALEELRESLAAAHRRESELEELCLSMQQQLAAVESRLEQQQKLVVAHSPSPFASPQAGPAFCPRVEMPSSTSAATPRESPSVTTSVTPSAMPNATVGVAVVPAAELDEIETTISRIEMTLERRGAWRAPLEDVLMLSTPRPNLPTPSASALLEQLEQLEISISPSPGMISSTISHDLVYPGCRSGICAGACASSSSDGGASGGGSSRGQRSGGSGAMAVAAAALPKEASLERRLERRAALYPAPKDVAVAFCVGAGLLGLLVWPGFSDEPWNGPATPPPAAPPPQPPPSAPPPPPSPRRAPAAPARTTASPWSHWRG